MSRSAGSARAASSSVSRMAPGSFTVLCSYGYLRRASISTGTLALSSRCFRSSLEIRGTDTRRIVIVASQRCQLGLRQPLRGYEFVDTSGLTNRTRERHDSGFPLEPSRWRALRGARDCRRTVDRPARGSLSAMDTAKEDGAGFAPHTEVMTSGQVAVQP